MGAIYQLETKEGAPENKRTKSKSPNWKQMKIQSPKNSSKILCKRKLVEPFLHKDKIQTFRYQHLKMTVLQGINQSLEPIY